MEPGDREGTSCRGRTRDNCAATGRDIAGRRREDAGLPIESAASRLHSGPSSVHQRYGARFIVGDARRNVRCDMSSCVCSLDVCGGLRDSGGAWLDSASIVGSAGSRR